MTAHPLPWSSTAGESTVDRTGAAAWTRIVLANLSRGILLTVLGVAFWAAVPAVVGWQPTTVVSGSMEPRLSIGDVVVTRPTDTAALQPGHVVLFDSPDQPGRLVLHRFIEAGPDATIVTKGDANPITDETPVSRDAVVGVAVLKAPLIGLPIVWLREGDIGRVTAVAVTLAALLMLSTVDGCLLRRRQEATTSPRSETEAPEAAPASEAQPIARTRDRRRHLRTWSVLVVQGVLVIAAGGATPDGAFAAPFAGATNARSTFGAAALVAPTAVTCINDPTSSSGVNITWTYSGVEPNSFDVLLANGSVVATAKGTDRTVNYNRLGLLELGTRYPVKVRTNLVGSWTADSSASVTIVVVAILGLTSVRCG